MKDELKQALISQLNKLIGECTQMIGYFTDRLQLNDEKNKIETAKRDALAKDSVPYTPLVYLTADDVKYCNDAVAFFQAQQKVYSDKLESIK